MSAGFSKTEIRSNLTLAQRNMPVSELGVASFPPYPPSPPKSGSLVYTPIQSGEFETPQDFFDKLNQEFHFTLDPCATRENAKCSKFYTKEDDGLACRWSPHTVFMNPPYGREIKYWVAKAYSESLLGATVVCLLPVRSDTEWFHTYALKSEIRFIRGRLRFNGPYSKGEPTPFPSMICVFRPRPSGEDV